MAHLITDLDTPIYAGRPAWHSLGQVIPTEKMQTLTFKQALGMGGADFDVEGIEVFGEWVTFDPQTGEPVVIRVPFKGFQGLIRTDWAALGGSADEVDALRFTESGLSVVTTDYAIGPNQDLADLFDAINAQAHDGRIIDPEAVVTLKGGKVIIVTGKLREAITLPGGDVCEPYIFGVTSHDRSQSTKGRSTIRRVECNNMLQAALLRPGKLDFTIRHTASRADLMKEAIAAMAFAVNDVRNFEAEATAMIETAVTDREFEQITKLVFAVKEDAKDAEKAKAEAAIAACKGLWADDHRVGNYKGTAWGAYQSISTWEQHMVGGSAAEKRNVMAQIGTGFAKTKAAAALLAPMVKR